jgi:RNA polymerase sigma-70 factor (ECF subfamily)
MRRSAAPTPSRASEVRVDTTATFERFYAVHRDRIVHAVALTVGDVHLADDATSEAMIKTHLRWDEVSRYENPAGWTYRVAVNHARGWRRTMLRRRTTPGAVPDVLTADQPTEIAAADDRLIGLLDRLSLDHRSVIVCRLFLDWSTEQTATALGISTGTVKSRLARALERLRLMLEDS